MGVVLVLSIYIGVCWPCQENTDKQPLQASDDATIYLVP